MVGGAVDDLLERVSGDHVRVVDEDGPEVDADEQEEVELALEGEEVDEQVVGDRLEVAVERVERMRGERRGDWRERGVSRLRREGWKRKEDSLSHLWWGL